jgi:hypothetical protein
MNMNVHTHMPVCFSYDLLPYLLSRIVIDLPILWLLSVCFSVPVVFLTGLQTGPVHFFKFVLTIFMLSQAMSSVGLFIGAVISHPVISLMLCPVVQVPFMISSGFFTNISSFPIVLRAIFVFSPHKYVFSNLMANEFLGLIFSCKDSERLTAPELINNHGFCEIASGEEVMRILALDTDTFGWNVLWLTLLSLFFQACAFLGLRRTSRKHRV